MAEATDNENRRTKIYMDDIIASINKVYPNHTVQRNLIEYVDPIEKKSLNVPIKGTVTSISIDENGDIII